MGFRHALVPAFLLLFVLAPSCGGQSARNEADDIGDAGENGTGGRGSPGDGGTTAQAGSEPGSGATSSSGASTGVGGTATPGGGTSSVGGVTVNGCDGAECGPPIECELGSSWQRLPGACCGACLRDPGPIGCLDIACLELDCVPGYTAGNPSNGGCCYECVPDPLYCVTNDDCLIAIKESEGCCPCPQVISRRLYEEDLCWSGPTDRISPIGCGFTACGDVSCEPCPDTGEPWCIDHHCQSAWVPPPN